MTGIPALFTPLSIGPIEVPNRIAVSPMCQYSAHDGSAGDWHMLQAMQFSVSGAGLAVLEVAGVNPEGRISLGCLGLYSDANEQALGKIVSAIRPWALPGFKIGIQIGHSGRKGSTPLGWERGPTLDREKGGWETVAPSPIAYAPGMPVPHELSHAEIVSLIDDFGEAARRALRAGFDLIEIHAAHGYLIHQFHSPVSNKRTDEWGGDESRRLRFPLAVAEAVRGATSGSVALGARITGTDFIDDGLTVEDAVVLARELKSRSFDYVCVSSGNILAGGRPATGPGFNLERAARVKAETGILTRTAGYIAGPRQANDAIANGLVDQVALGRAFLDDAHWGWHAAEALGYDLSPPKQYQRIKAGQWPGSRESRAFAL